MTGRETGLVANLTPKEAWKIIEDKGDTQKKNGCQI